MIQKIYLIVKDNRAPGIRVHQLADGMLLRSYAWRFKTLKNYPHH